MEKIDPNEVWAAALADDSEKLHRLATGVGMSMRITLYHAGVRMLNAIAAMDARFQRLREVQRRLDAGRRHTLLAARDASRSPYDAAGLIHAIDPGALGELVAMDLLTETYELTDDGREVVATLDARLLSAAQDRALSDEDVCHE